MTNPRSMRRETNEPDGDGVETTTDPARSKAWLEEDSDALLAAVEDLRRLELEKREAPIASEGFHRRAKEIELRSRMIFGLAHEQEQVGRTFGETQEDSIEDVAREREDGASDDGAKSPPIEHSLEPGPADERR
jgi:hypothetical protein